MTTTHTLQAAPGLRAILIRALDAYAAYAGNQLGDAAALYEEVDIARRAVHTIKPQGITVETPLPTLFSETQVAIKKDSPTPAVTNYAFGPEEPCTTKIKHMLLGAKFRYPDDNAVFVLLSHAGTGKCADIQAARPALQGMYTIGPEGMETEVVPVE